MRVCVPLWPKLHENFQYKLVWCRRWVAQVSRSPQLACTTADAQHQTKFEPIEKHLTCTHRKCVNATDSLALLSLFLAHILFALFRAVRGAQCIVLITWYVSPFQVLKSSSKDYDRLVFNYSLKNQLRFKGNLGGFRALQVHNFCSQLIALRSKLWISRSVYCVTFNCAFCSHTHAQFPI